MKTKEEKQNEEFTKKDIEKLKEFVIEHKDMLDYLKEHDEQ